MPDTDPYLVRKSPRDVVLSVARDDNIPDDVADDFLKVTGGIESGSSHYWRNGKVKTSPVDPKDGQRAIGFSQIKPATARSVGVTDPYNEIENIKAGLRYFARGGNDPVRRRIAYFSGTNSKAVQYYDRTGKIPSGGDFTGTSFTKYVTASGGFQNAPQDPYLVPKQTQAPADPYLTPKVQTVTKHPASKQVVKPMRRRETPTNSIYAAAQERASTGTTATPQPDFGLTLKPRQTTEQIVQGGINSPEANLRHGIREQVKAERTKDGSMLGYNDRLALKVITSPVETVTNLFRSEDDIVNDEVEARRQAQLRFQTPEMTAQRKEFDVGAPLRSVIAPAARAGAGLVKALGGITSGLGIAPNQLSDYLNHRGQILEEASNAPLDEQGNEIKRGLPEKVVSALGDVGFGIAEVIALKKIAPSMSLSQIFAVETALKTSDMPLAQRTDAVAKSAVMGKVLDHHLSRVASAAVFGVPTAIETGQAYSKGNMSAEDALLQTGVQAATGALMGGKPKGEAQTLTQVPDINKVLANREAAVRPSIRLSPRSETNALPIRESAKIPLAETPGDSEAVGARISEPREVANAQKVGATQTQGEATTPHHSTRQKRRIRNTETGKAGQFKKGIEESTSANLPTSEVSSSVAKGETASILDKRPWEVTLKELEGRWTRAQHREDVEAALKQGFDVPSRVLAEYRDLKPSPQGEVVKQNQELANAGVMPKGWPDVKRGDVVYVDGKPVTVAGVSNGGLVLSAEGNITNRYSKLPPEEASSLHDQAKAALKSPDGGLIAGQWRTVSLTREGQTVNVAVYQPTNVKGEIRVRRILQTPNGEYYAEQMPFNRKGELQEGTRTRLPGDLQDALKNGRPIPEKYRAGFPELFPSPRQGEVVKTETGFSVSSPTGSIEYGKVNAEKAIQQPSRRVDRPAIAGEELEAMATKKRAEPSTPSVAEGASFPERVSPAAELQQHAAKAVAGNQKSPFPLRDNEFILPSEIAQRAVGIPSRAALETENARPYEKQSSVKGEPQIAPTKVAVGAKEPNVSSGGGGEIPPSTPVIKLKPRKGQRSFPETVKRVGYEAESSTYDVLPNVETVAKANETIKAKGVNLAVAELSNRKGEFSPEDVAVGSRAIQEYEKSGQMDKAIETVETLAENLTKAGQTVQAASIIARLSPEGTLLYAQRRLPKGEKLDVKQGEMLVAKSKEVRVVENQLVAKDNEMTIPQLRARLRELEGQAKEVKKSPRAKVEGFQVRMLRMEAEARASLQARTEQAKLELKGPKGQRGSSVNPAAVVADIADWTKIGAAKIARGGVDFAQWSKSMLDEFGEAIRPHLNKVFTAAHGLAKEQRALAKSEGQVRSVEKKLRKMPKTGETGPYATPEAVRKEIAARLEMQKRAQKTNRELQQMYDHLSRTKLQRGLSGATGMRRANLLTAAKTLLRNIPSNAAHMVSEGVARPAAALADMAAMRLKKTGVRTTTGLDFPAESRTIYNAVMKEGPRRAADIILGREVLPLAGYGKEKESLASKMQLQRSDTGIKLLDFYIDKVFASQEAVDAPFKIYAFSRELADIAKSQAITERQKDKTINVTRRAKELRQNPTDAMLMEAAAYADYATFQNDNTVSRVIRSGKRLIGPAGKFTVETVAPFDRTPTNILYRAFENSPLGFISAAKKFHNIGNIKGKELSGLPTARAQKGVADAIADAAFTRAEQKEFARTFGRASTGTLLAGLALMLAHKGLLSGSSDYNDDKGDYMKKRKEVGGGGMLRVPGTNQRIYIADTPVGKAMATVAAMYEQATKDKKGDETDADLRDRKITGAVKSVGRLALNQPLLQGTRDLFSGRSLSESAGNYMGSMIPGSSALTQIGEIADPEARKTYGEGFAAQIKKVSPYHRRSLPINTGVNKDERGGLGRRMLRGLDPFNTTTEGKGATSIKLKPRASKSAFQFYKKKKK